MGAFITYSTVRHTIGAPQPPRPLLLGRDTELAQLDAACADPHIPLLLLIAPAGTGKTALLHHWLWRCEATHWEEMDAVIGWSFTGAVNDDDPQAILRDFLEYALVWLGVTFSAEQNCIEKAGLLVQHLQQQRVLLVLDHIPAAMLHAAPEHNELTACWFALLKPLAIENRGFCLVTLEDDSIFGYVGELLTHGHCLHLPNLPQVEGVKVLLHHGLQGSAKALGKVSALFEHHPLTLTLLAPYLQGPCGGDLGQLDTIPIWLDSHSRGHQARRLLAAYESWLANTPELALVYVLSLFEQSIAPQRLLDLCEMLFHRRFFFIWPKLPLILAPLGRLNSKKLLHLQQRLHDLHLLSAYAEPGVLALHSVIHEYFAQKFALTFMAEWRHLRGLLLEYDVCRVTLPPIRINFNPRKRSPSLIGY